MSDFLRNLVRRGAGLAAVVAPRGAPPSVEIAAEDVVEEARAAQAAVEPMPPVRARPVRAEVVPEKTQPRRMEAAPARAPEKHAEAAPASVRPASREPQAPASPRREAAREEISRSDVVKREKPVPQAVELEAHAQPESAPEVLERPEPPQAPAAAASQVLILRAPAAEAPRREASVQPRQAERPAPPPAQTVVHIVAPRGTAPVAAEGARGAASAIEAEQEREEQQRGVEVRIGRIEIHQAGPPPAPARRPVRGFDSEIPARRYLDRRWY